MLVVINVFAQNEKNENKLLGSEFSFSFGITSGNFKNKNIENDENKIVDKKNGLILGANYTRYFNDRFGVSLGLGYSSYSQNVIQKGQFELAGQIDIDGYEYDKLFISDVVESTSIGMLELPLMLKVIVGNPKKIYGLAEVGFVYGLSIKNNYTKTGSIETQGKYYANSYTDILGHNFPEYGYEKDVFVNQNKSIYGNSNLSGRISFGLVSVVSENVSIKIIPTYTFGLKDITREDLKGKEYFNVYGQKSDYSTTKLSAVGIQFGISLAI